MGVLDTRPSEKSERRTVILAVVLSALFAAFCTTPAPVHAKPRAQATKNSSVNSKQQASRPAALIEKAKTKKSAKSAGKPVEKSVSTAKPAPAKKSLRSGKVVSRATPVTRSVKVDRITKVDRSRPSKRVVIAKASGKKSAPARKTQELVAKARRLSDDPWQRAIQLDRAKLQVWDTRDHHETRQIALPDMFGFDDERAEELLTEATRLLGRPYRFGARGHAFDCSGFTAEVFEKMGLDLPHSARDQFGIGDRIAREELAPGDLVFFTTYRRGASHVGIYMGEDKFIHAASGFGVKISSLNEDYYAARFLGARRLSI